MVKQAVLSHERKVMGNGLNSIVIRRYLSGIIGGTTLNMDGFPHDVIHAGHVIIKDTVNNEFKPMPLNEAGNAYASLPSNHTYAGVCMQSATKEQPIVGIMYAGEVNDVASPFPVDDIKSAMASALPQLVYMHD